MKLFKKMLSVITAVTMLSVIPVAGAFAASNTLPDQSKNGEASITVHKYGVDASYDQHEDYEADGKEITDSNTVIGTREDENGDTVDVTLGELNALENISFKIERVIAKTDSEGNIITPVEYVLDTTFISSIKPTDATGSYTFDNLDFGIYVITEQPSAAVTQVADPTYVSVPMNNPTDPSEWLYDIHIYPKNQIEGPNIDKSVSYLGNQHDTVDLTEKVKWIITSQIPADVAASKEYIITDDLTRTLRYATDPAVLAVSYIDADTDSPVTLTPNTDATFSDDGAYDYTLIYSTGSATAYPWTDSLTIKLTKQGRAKIAAALSSNPDATLPRLTVEFYTSFDIPKDNIGENLAIALENQAKLKYTNSANVTYEPETQKPEVHTGGVLLKKVNPKGEVLSGAQFKIYKSLDDAMAGTNAIKDPTNSSIDWVVTSAADTGLVGFYGLAYGTRAASAILGDAYDKVGAETTYYIVEVAAPKDSDGNSYNLLKEPLAVKVNATSHLTVNAIKVVNSRFSLPLTGGTGTLILTIGGILLIGAAGVILFKSKKKKQA